MNNYKILVTKQAKKDSQKVACVPVMKKNVNNLIELLKIDPFKQPPFYESLVGELKGAYSRRINHQHRLVYTVDEENKEVVLLRMWTHYD